MSSISLVTDGMIAGGGGYFTPTVGSLMTKTQFLSNESLQIVIPPFINRADGSQYLGTDTVTLVVKRPDGTLLPSPPSVIFDSDVHLWTATITSSSFIQGEWLILASSNGTNSQGQNLVLIWGDYVDKIYETHQAAFGRWRIDTPSRKLFLYGDDGTTILKTFDLKDSTGSASVTQIFERDPE